LSRFSFVFADEDLLLHSELIGFTLGCYVQEV